MKKYKKIRIRQTKANYLKAIVAGLFCCSGIIGNAQAQDTKTEPKATTTTKATEKVHCYGINACKGKSDCHTAKNSCSGKNSCKGQGWKLLTQEECKTGGGTVKTEKKAKKS